MNKFVMHFKDAMTLIHQTTFMRIHTKPSGTKELTVCWALWVVI